MRAVHLSESKEGKMKHIMTVSVCRAQTDNQVTLAKNQLIALLIEVLPLIGTIYSAKPDGDSRQY